MPLRPALPSDHPAMALVASRAFINDELFGEFMHPHRHAHSTDYLSSWQRGLDVKCYDPTRKYVVSVDDSGKVVAWACWLRVGPGAEEIASPWSLRARKFYAEKADQLHTYLWPDKSADEEHIAGFYSSIPLTEHLWSGARSESWLLDLLCTDPAHERQGHGKALVEWGIKLAEEEKVCASVIAAWERDGFYERFGFREVGRANVGPLSEIKGGAVMFKDL